MGLGASRSRRELIADALRRGVPVLPPAPGDSSFRGWTGPDVGPRPQER